MSSARSRWIWKFTALAVAGVSVLAVVVALVVPRMSAYAVGIHQRSTTKELQQWAQDYRSLEDAGEASRAIDMLEYIPNYYPVQEGYRSDPATEAALERQRAETIDSIISGLQDFSSRDYGKDVAQWRSWLQQKQVIGVDAPVDR